MTDEAEQIPTLDGRAKWRPLVLLLRRQWKGLALGVAVGLLWTVGKVAVPQLTGLAIDRAIVGAGSAWGWAFLIACAGVVTGVFTALRRYVAFGQSRLTEMRLREHLLQHILGLHIGYHDHAPDRSADEPCVERPEPGTGVRGDDSAHDLELRPDRCGGRHLVRHRSDAGGVRTGAAALRELRHASVSSRIHPAVLEVQQEQAQLASVVEETVSGVRVIKGLGAERVQADKLEAEADDIQRVSLDAARIRAVYLPFIDLLPAVGLIAVLAIGGHRAQRRADDRRAGEVQLLCPVARVAIAHGRHDGGVRSAGHGRTRTDRPGAQHDAAGPRPGVTF